MNPRVMAVSGMMVMAACNGGGPAAIAYDADPCTRCHMQISDRRFAAAIVTKRGRTLKFDSIECLRTYAANPDITKDVVSVWVADFAHPGTLIPANLAKFFDAGAQRSPMGASHGWAAVAGKHAAATLLGVDSTKLVSWSELP